ncbi:MAG: hypothetical protein SPF09_01395, partial [Bacteroidaceae bacterium]|nr:hypothetical protein [Bacteroidaceae bacterium]
MTVFTIVTPEEDILGGVSVPVMNKSVTPSTSTTWGGEGEKSRRTAPRSKFTGSLLSISEKHNTFAPRKEERKKKHYVRHYVIQDSGGDPPDLPPHTASGRLYLAWIM